MYRNWKNKKVLITGHTGFVGAWLACVLDYMGADTVGFALPEEKGSLYDKIKGNLRIKSVYGDLRDCTAIADCVKKNGPDIIFHMAAFGFVKECHEDPDRAYSSNVMGTLHLLHALRDLNKSCRLVAASSDKVYRNNDREMYLFMESDPLGGSDPYSASKTCEDILIQSYYDSYLSKTDKSVCVVRPSNILGGGDHNSTRLIPSIYNGLQKGKEVEIRNPLSFRPWQNIFDVVDAYLTLSLNTENGCSVYNVGPENEGIKSVGEIADYVMGLYDKETRFIKGESNDVKEKAFLGLSIEKIREEIGWRPNRTLEETLREIFEFYHRDTGNNIYELCMEQINNYYKCRGRQDEELDK